VSRRPGREAEVRLSVLGLVLALTLLAAPPSVEAQLAPGVHRIGWLSPAAATTGGDNLAPLRG